MTLKEACRYGAEILTNNQIENPDLDAWLLLEHVTGISRAAYYADPNRELSAKLFQHFETCIKRRAQHVPLQHITGIQEFMGIAFQVNEHVLIPRQDTEVLVEAVEMMLPQIARNTGKETRELAVLDMCTGSGCILLSLLKRQHLGCGVGVDISPAALAVAMQNAKQLEVAASFLESDLFARVAGRFDVIVSNPPYIQTEVISKLQEEVQDYDPYGALDGGADGLAFYRRIIVQGKDYLVSGGGLFFEIGSDQGAAVAELMSKAGYKDIIVKKDLTGLDRVVYGCVQ